MPETVYDFPEVRVCSITCSNDVLRQSDSPYSRRFTSRDYSKKGGGKQWKLTGRIMRFRTLFAKPISRISISCVWNPVFRLPLKSNELGYYKCSSIGKKCVMWLLMSQRLKFGSAFRSRNHPKNVSLASKVLSISYARVVKRSSMTSRLTMVIMSALISTNTKINSTCMLISGRNFKSSHWMVLL